MSEYQLDKIDRAILTALMKDAKKPYHEMAKELIVSNGTIHVRIQKMRDAGLITGSRITIDHAKLGMGVSSFIGINLTNAGDYESVLAKLTTFPEIVDVHYTTGQYSIFAKIVTKDTKSLHNFLIEKLQSISEIQSTETLISLDNPVNREVSLLD